MDAIIRYKLFLMCHLQLNIEIYEYKSEDISLVEKGGE